MSLIPYHPQEGREIVLRHRNAIVVRDPSSQRLEIRGLAECPTCHRPLHDDAGGGSGSGSNGGSNSGNTGGGIRHDDYVDPNYFRMLRAGYRVGQLRAAAHGGDAPTAAADTDTTENSGTTATGTTRAIRRLFRPLAGMSSGSGSGNVRESIPTAATTTEAASVTDLDGGAETANEDAGGTSTTASSSASGGIDVLASRSYGPTTAERRSSIRKEAFSPHYFETFFVEERELGRGGKGVVLLVRHEIDGCQLGHFACKRVPVGDDHAWLERVLVEVEVLAKLSHPNLVSYRHVWLENVTLTRFGPSVACAFILQQYCNGGDLHRYVVGDLPKEATKEELKEQLKARLRRRSRGGAEGEVVAAAAAAADLPGPGVGDGGSTRPQPQRRLQFDEIYSLFKDVTSGLAYLHAANYVHRDLKPSNCLLHREGRTLTCLISDFGEVQPENTVRRSTGTTGTLSYCAPEVLRRGAGGDNDDGPYGNFTTKSDVFSLGMILYFLCFGRLPYRSANTLHEELEDAAALRAEIVGWKGFQAVRRERQDLPSKLYALLTRMLSVDPAARPSAAEVLLAMRTDATVGVGGGGGGGGFGVEVDVEDEAAVADSDVSSASASSSSASSTAAAGMLRSPSNRLVQKQRNNRNSGSLTWAPGRGHPLALSPERSGSGGGGGGSGFERQHRRRSSASPRRRRRPQDLTRPLSSSPVSSEAAVVAVGAAGDTATAVGSVAAAAAAAAAVAAPMNTPLLMPPPTTFLGEVRHRGRVARHHARQFAQRHAESLVFLLRTTLFFAKMASLARPCWPFMVRPTVGASLVLVAGLDLGVPALSGSAGQTTAATAAAAAAAARIMMFVDQRGDVLLPQVPQRQQQSQWWWWDGRVSVLLFVLHFVVLGVASRTGVLCTGGHEAWADW